MTVAAIDQDFLDMLQALLAAGADFVVVGAHALAVHGVPRATGDLDILVRPTAQNAQRVMAALREFGAPVDAHGIVERDFAVEGTVYQLGLPPRRIDFLTMCSGLSFEDVWRDRIHTTVGGHRISVMGRQALIKNKMSTGRTQDLADIEALTAQKKDGASTPE